MIENIILRNDRRGVATKAAAVLGHGFIRDAAKQLLQSKNSVAIATGFLVNGLPETDGPPGAVFLGQALARMGHHVVYVAHPLCAELVRETINCSADIEPFPLGDIEHGDAFAKQFLDRYSPAALISVECLGPNPLGSFLDMRGRDASSSTSRIDRLFNLANSSGVATVGIGDGGNEIGFGSIDARHNLGLKDGHCVTAVDHLVVASVSNWGAYGLIAQLEQFGRRTLLPSIEEETELIERMVSLGAVDGFSGDRILAVDGLALKDNSTALRLLHEFSTESGKPIA